MITNNWKQTNKTYFCAKSASFVLVCITCMCVCVVFAHMLEMQSPHSCGASSYLSSLLPDLWGCEEKERDPALHLFVFLWLVGIECRSSGMLGSTPSQPAALQVWQDREEPTTVTQCFSRERTRRGGFSGVNLECQNSLCGYLNNIWACFENRTHI